MSNDAPRRRGLLFVVSAPSGTGKTTLVERAVTMNGGLERSRSYTSRPRRSGEREGVDYNFVSRADFDAFVARGEFLEWAEVFGNRYGTRQQDTEARLAAGIDLVLVIDVQGASQVRARVPDAIGVFVLPPSFDVLERRLRERCQDSDGAIAQRLRTARREVTAIDQYDYVIVNDDLERCAREFVAIVGAERARRERRRPEWEEIVRDMTSG
jgi:guanylate kinase